MNIQETLALIEALKAAGVTKFKSLEHDIVFNGESAHAPIKQFKPQTEVSPTPVQENFKATEQLKDLISTIKLSDEELANRLFPDGAL